MPAPVLQDFTGDWTLSREIEDFAQDRRGRMTGTARFMPERGGLRCREAGTLAFDGLPPMATERETIWQASDDGIEVAFADGRPFHSFRPGDLSPAARHDCAPDLYLVTYDFARWPDWRAEWRVTGPRKDYRMTTRYTRA